MEPRNCNEQEIGFPSECPIGILRRGCLADGANLQSPRCDLTWPLIPTRCLLQWRCGGRARGGAAKKNGQAAHTGHLIRTVQHWAPWPAAVTMHHRFRSPCRAKQKVCPRLHSMTREPEIVVQLHTRPQDPNAKAHSRRQQDPRTHCSHLSHIASSIDSILVGMPLGQRRSVATFWVTDTERTVRAVAKAHRQTKSLHTAHSTGPRQASGRPPGQRHHRS